MANFEKNTKAIAHAQRANIENFDPSDNEKLSIPSKPSR